MEIACCSSTATAASLLLRRRSRSPSPTLALASSFRGAPLGLSSASGVHQLSRSRLSISPSTYRSRSGRVALECKCIFGLGVPELVVIAGVAALVFGPKQLPEIGRNIGKTVKGFQQAAKEFETELTKTPPEGDAAPPENPQPVAGGEPKKELETSSTKESL
ncbi:hypothetical protein LUZ61_016570 [Rhynchospora tenuis]|uniref:Sec-independent protein translocase protein TATA, chloroplastic n=1 Tax=Rhynchospora tenuis TaxID=198213 RepID=A0AAD6EK45_9POAL|nr:hypothetical protein LUZ61_016570 [Rhynchospora tenuis]